MEAFKQWAGSIRNISGELLNLVTSARHHTVREEDAVQNEPLLSHLAPYQHLQHSQGVQIPAPRGIEGNASVGALWETMCDSDQSDFPIPSSVLPRASYQDLQASLQQAPAPADPQGPPNKPSTGSLLISWSLKNLNHVFSFPFSSSMLGVSSQGQLQETIEAQQEVQLNGVPHHVVNNHAAADSPRSQRDETGVSASEMPAASRQEVRLPRCRVESIARFREKKRRRVEAQQQCRSGSCYGSRERSVTPPLSPPSPAPSTANSDFEIDNISGAKVSRPRTGRRLKHAQLPDDERKALHVMAHRASAARSNAKKKEAMERARDLEAVVQPVLEGLHSVFSSNPAIRDVLLENCLVHRDILEIFLDNQVNVDELLQDFKERQLG